MSAQTAGCSQVYEAAQPGCRALAEEDWTGGGAGAVADAAGKVGAALYHKGALQQSKLPLPAYLTRKAGMYPDVAEQLVMNHLEKDDLMSALITGEWCGLHLETA